MEASFVRFHILVCRCFSVFPSYFSASSALVSGSFIFRFVRRVLGTGGFPARLISFRTTGRFHTDVGFACPHLRSGWRLLFHEPALGCRRGLLRLVHASQPLSRIADFLPASSSLGYRLCLSVVIVVIFGWNDERQITCVCSSIRPPVVV
jgi:hypothetical protein